VDNGADFLKKEFELIVELLSETNQHDKQSTMIDCTNDDASAIIKDTDDTTTTTDEERQEKSNRNTIEEADEDEKNDDIFPENVEDFFNNSKEQGRKSRKRGGNKEVLNLLGKNSRYLEEVAKIQSESIKRQRKPTERLEEAPEKVPAPKRKNNTNNKGSNKSTQSAKLKTEREKEGIIKSTIILQIFVLHNQVHSYSLHYLCCTNFRPAVENIKINRQNHQQAIIFSNVWWFNHSSAV
jgi:hypothetical protein